MIVAKAHRSTDCERTRRPEPNAGSRLHAKVAHIWRVGRHRGVVAAPRLAVADVDLADQLRTFIAAARERKPDARADEDRGGAGALVHGSDTWRRAGRLRRTREVERDADRGLAHVLAEEEAARDLRQRRVVVDEDLAGIEARLERKSLRGRPLLGLAARRGCSRHLIHLGVALRHALEETAAFLQVLPFLSPPAAAPSLLEP